MGRLCRPVGAPGRERAGDCRHRPPPPPQLFPGGQHCARPVRHGRCHHCAPAAPRARPGARPRPGARHRCHPEVRRWRAWGVWARQCVKGWWRFESIAELPRSPPPPSPATHRPPGSRIRDTLPSSQAAGSGTSCWAGRALTLISRRPRLLPRWAGGGGCGDVGCWGSGRGRGGLMGGLHVCSARSPTATVSRPSILDAHLAPPLLHLGDGRVSACDPHAQ